MPNPDPPHYIPLPPTARPSSPKPPWSAAPFAVSPPSRRGRIGGRAIVCCGLLLRARYEAAARTSFSLFGRRALLTRRSAGLMASPPFTCEQPSPPRSRIVSPASTTSQHPSPGRGWVALRAIVMRPSSPVRSPLSKRPPRSPTPNGGESLLLRLLLRSSSSLPGLLTYPPYLHHCQRAPSVRCPEGVVALLARGFDQGATYTLLAEERNRAEHRRAHSPPFTAAAAAEEQAQRLNDLVRKAPPPGFTPRRSKVRDERASSVTV